MSDFDRWVEDARGITLEDAASMLGCNLKKNGAERTGPCPACGGNDRFSINIKKSVFNCRGCNMTGVNAIDLVMKGRGLEFVRACEFLMNEAAPRSDGEKPAESKGRDRSIDEADKDKDNQKRILDKQSKAKQLSKSEQEFNGLSPIFGTLAEKYYRARDIAITKEQAVDLRFSPAREYWHEVDGEMRVIGTWPCIVAAVRDEGDGIAGLHLTYLDHKEPIKATIFSENAEGRKERLPPKKMRVGKGLIRLGPVRPIMAIGEGKETTLAWGLLERVSGDFCLAAAGDLGHFSGRSLGRVPHPRFERETILDGKPDMDSDFMAIPPGVKEVILLGDGDWNHEKITAHLLTAGRRLKQMGIAVSVDRCPTPPERLRNEVKKGWDWNDILSMKVRGEI